MSDYRSPLLGRPGAVEATGLDCGVAAHYGSPLIEQRALADAEAVVDHSSRGVLTIEGPERLSWLHRLVSQHVEDIPAGTSVEALVLDAHGRIEHEIHLYEDGERCWLIVERQQSAPLAQWLASMRFLFEVTITDVSAEWAVVSSTSRISSLSRVWQDPWPGPTPGGAAYSTQPHPGAGRPWYEHVVPRHAHTAEHAAGGEITLPELAEQYPLVGATAAEALRVAAWRPRWGRETDAKSLPHELDLLRTAVHLNKGCYRGQETVSRVHHVGRPPRRLTFLDLDGFSPNLPAPGAHVFVGEELVGTLTSSAHHYEMGPIGLAILRRATDPDATVTVRGEEGDVHTAAQQVIVSPEAGKAAGIIPRLPRLRPPQGR